MNKLGLLLCFLFIVNISAEEEKDMVGKVYDIIINLLEGMSKEKRCSRIFQTKKDQIFPIIKEAVNDFKNGQSFSELVVSYGFRLLAVEDLAVECKAFTLFELFSKVTSKDGIKDIGVTIQERANDIYKLVSLLKTTKGIENKVKIAGEIFAIILKFKVY